VESSCSSSSRNLVYALRISHTKVYLTMSDRRSLRFLPIFLAFLSACTSSTATGYALEDWPWKEYWAGLALNGSQIGYAHLALSPVADAENRLEIQSEALMRFQLLGASQVVEMVSTDRVFPDLALERFAYDYNLGGNRLILRGTVSGNRLDVEIDARQGLQHQALTFDGEIYPTSAIGLYPVVHGLEVGRRYEYLVYSGETQSIEPVVQEVLAHEEGGDRFDVPAFRVRTRLLGQEVTTWTDAEGRPLLEISLNGLLTAALEQRDEARSYLALGALNKREALLEFSLIRTDRPIAEPGKARRLEVLLEGVPGDFALPSDSLQECRREGEKSLCRLVSGGSSEQRSLGGKAGAYLEPSLAVPSRDERIRALAKETADPSGDAEQQARRLVDWIQSNIIRVPVDVFSALDVLDTGKAECQGHSYLYAAFARSLGIPTRVVNGIVYSEQFGGFLYHTWAESLLNGRWIAVDPTFGQIPADATHIKLIEGESLAELLPLTGLVGRMRVQVLAVEHY
jgi:hypothetical protein